MTKIITLEVTNSGTLTRVAARVLNAHLRKTGSALAGEFSGSTAWTSVDDALTREDLGGAEIDYVPATSLTPAQKGAHTKVVNASRRAQARREARKAAEVAAA
jgi:hypothetical protein